MEGLDTQVFSPAEDFISLFTKRLGWINPMLSDPPKEDDEEYAKLMYIAMIKSMVSGLVFGEREMTVVGKVGPEKKKSSTVDIEKRKRGGDWTYLGDTMTGLDRLDNVRDIITRVIKDNIPGDYIGEDTSLLSCCIRCNRYNNHSYLNALIQKLEFGVEVQASLREQLWLHMEQLIAYHMSVILFRVYLLEIGHWTRETRTGIIHLISKYPPKLSLEALTSTGSLTPM